MASRAHEMECDEMLMKDIEDKRTYFGTWRRGGRKKANKNWITVLTTSMTESARNEVVRQSSGTAGV